MWVDTVRPFVIENETEVGDYLRALFENPEYRSIDLVIMRAQKYIKDDPHLENYFLNKAKELLKTYGHEID